MYVGDMLIISFWDQLSPQIIFASDTYTSFYFNSSVSGITAFNIKWPILLIAAGQYVTG